MPKYFPGSSVCNCSGVFRTGVNLTLSQLWLSLSFSHQNNLVLFLVLGDALRIITFHQTLCALPGFVFFFTHICILPTYEHCSITVRALYAHTVRLLHDYCAITVRLLCDYCAITVRLLYYTFYRFFCLLTLPATCHITAESHTGPRRKPAGQSESCSVLNAPSDCWCLFQPLVAIPLLASQRCEDYPDHPDCKDV